MGGIEQLIHQLATGSVKLGLKVDILSLSRNAYLSKIEMNGYWIHYVPLNFEIASTGVSVRAFWRFYQLAKQADIIHYHFPWPYMDVLHFLLRIRKPTVLTYHSDIIRQRTLNRLYRPLKNLFLKSMNQIVATSPNYITSSTVLAKYKDRVKVIPIGLDRANYPDVDLDRLQFWRDKIGTKFFLFVVVIRYYK